MTDLLWMRPDAVDGNPNYVRTFQATVRKARGDWVLLDRTAFYKGGGGQPPDQGTLSWDGGEADVVDVQERGVVRHVLDGPLPEEGAAVAGSLDWPRRYRIMRAHTAQHVASVAVHETLGAGTRRADIDEASATLTLDEPADPTALDEAGDRLRDLLEADLPVRVHTMDRDRVEEAVDDDRVDLSRVPSGPRRLRVVEIGDADLCPCGGTHVGSTGECSPLEDLRAADEDHEVRLELGPRDPPDNRNG